MIDRKTSFKSEILATAYHKFSLSGDARVIAGFIMPVSLIIQARVASDAVAVRAIMFTCDGTRFRSSDRCEYSTLNFLPLYHHVNINAYK